MFSRAPGHLDVPGYQAAQDTASDRSPAAAKIEANEEVSCVQEGLLD